MSLADKLADLFTLETLDNMSWKLSDGVKLGDFFYDRGIPPHIIWLPIIIAAVLAYLFFFPAPPDLCGNGICDPTESWMTCPQDCPAPDPTDISVRISEDLPAGEYSVGLYNSEGLPITALTASPGESTDFEGFRDTSATLKVNGPMGDDWIAELDLTPSEDAFLGDDEPDNAEKPDEKPGESGSRIIVEFPQDFERETGGSDDPLTEIIRGMSVGVCLGGYLNSEPTLEEAYLAYLMDILDSISVTGVPAPDADTRCADINNDGYLTIEDRLCLSGSIENEFASLAECPKCVPLPFEVCGDGVDNNCDGQTDRDVYDNKREEFYRIGGQIADLCSCNELTPCEMMRADTGLFNMHSEENVSRCSSFGGDYQWRPYSEWACGPSKANEVLTCGGMSFTCVNHMGEWLWNGSCMRYPDMSYTCDCNNDGFCDLWENATSCANDCPTALFDMLSALETAILEGRGKEPANLSAGESVSRGEMLLRLDSVQLSLECDASVCSGISVSGGTISAGMYTEFLADAVCEFVAGEYSCVLTIRDLLSQPSEDLASLIENALDHGTYSGTIFMPAGDAIEVLHIEHLLGIYLDIGCEGDPCSSLNLEGSSASALADIVVTAEISCTSAAIQVCDAILK
jgi:hypothetical protein